MRLDETTAVSIRPIFAG